MLENTHPTPAASLDQPPKSGRTFVIVLVAAILAISIAVMIYVWRGRIPAQPGMLYVPEGTFLAGPDKKSTQLNAYFIDETEVSNADFAEFCGATSTNGCIPPTGAPDLPVVNITVVQARAFAQWKGKRLPTQMEWERIARGVDGGRYPWGDTDDLTAANLRDNPKLAAHALMSVKSFKALPAYQMAGNAWEMLEGNITPPDADVARFAETPEPSADTRRKMDRDSRWRVRYAHRLRADVHLVADPRALRSTRHRLPLREESLRPTTIPFGRLDLKRATWRGSPGMLSRQSCRLFPECAHVPPRTELPPARLPTAPRPLLRLKYGIVRVVFRRHVLTSPSTIWSPT